MIAEWKRLWLARLRDPDAKRCRWAYRNGEAMCAIGHLYDAVNPGKWSGDRPFAYGCLWRWMGLSENEADRLIMMNDRDGLTLPEIADWVEQNIASVATNANAKEECEA